MKVAVCFSGHMRTFEKTAASIKQYLFDQYDCKVFIHAWDSLGSSRKDIDIESLKLNDVELIKAYNPSSFVIEQSYEFNPGYYAVFQRARIQPKNVLSRWNSSKKSFELCKKWSLENNHQFDVVLFIRPDLLFCENIELVMPEPNTLYIPGNIEVPKRVYHDYIAYGSFYAMEKYFNLAQYWDKLCQGLSDFRPEEVLTAYIKFLGIKVNYFNVYYSIIRMNGSTLEMGYRKFPNEET